MNIDGISHELTGKARRRAEELAPVPMRNRFSWTYRKNGEGTRRRVRTSPSRVLRSLPSMRRLVGFTPPRVCRVLLSRVPHDEEVDLLLPHQPFRVLTRIVSAIEVHKHLSAIRQLPRAGQTRLSA